MGGDEFAILCDGTTARDGAVELGEQIQSIFAAPFVVRSLSIPLTCARGFAFFPSSAVEPGELVRLADAALYRAKAAGPGGATEFDAKPRRSVATAAAREHAVRRTAEPDGVSSRPFVAFSAGRIRSSEQAARLYDPSLMPIASPAFISARAQTRPNRSRV
jgi:predicted signal transduction protein with EAL and GGDEF domain